jgi:FlaA1/EpsC-like NDP-sugar epimerase
MTIPEASQLVLQAGILGATGKVFVLNMGSPVRVLDLAMDMARLSGLTPGIDIDIKFTGMRPGDKLFEELFMDSEQVGLDPDAKMFEAVQAPISPKRLDENLHLLREAIRLPDGLRQREILRCFKRLVPSYQPASTGLGRHDSAESELLMPGFEEVPSVN